MIGAIVGDIVGSRFEWHNRKRPFLRDVGVWGRGGKAENAL